MNTGGLIFLLSFVVPSALLAEKVLKFSEDGAPTNLDPAQAGTAYAAKVVQEVYDTLYEYKYLKVPFELKPRLAEAMPEISSSGLVYKIKMKKGVRFADDPAFQDGKGREVVAEDFVYSIKRHFDPKTLSQGAWLWQEKIVGMEDWKKAGADDKKEVAGLKALDRHTIQITLTKPFPQLVYTLEVAFAGVVPREAVEKYGQEFAIKPVGSGPFKLLSHTSKLSVLVRNPTYRLETFDPKAEGYDAAKHGFTGIEALAGQKLPIVDRVEINWMEEPTSRWNSFSKGNEIVNTTLQNEQVDELLEQRNPARLRKKYAEKYHFRQAMEAGFVFTHFNMDDPTIGNHPDPVQRERQKGLRCAIRKAFDWRQRIDRFYLGIGDPYPGYITPETEGYDPAMSKESVTYDAEGAKELLKKYGWNEKNLPTLRYSGIASVRDKQFFEQFRGWLRKIGYPKEKIKEETFASFGDFNKAVKNRKLQLIPMAWALDYPDAENTLAQFYGPNQSPGSNTANYDNPEFNKLFAQAAVMNHSDERTAIYRKLNQMIVDDCATISAFSRTRVYLWHKNVVMWWQRDIMNNILKYVDVK